MTVLSNSLKLSLDASAAQLPPTSCSRSKSLASLSRHCCQPTRASRHLLDFLLSPVDLSDQSRAVEGLAYGYEQRPCLSSLAAYRLHRTRRPPRLRRNLQPTPLILSHSRRPLPLQHRNEQTRSPPWPRSSPRALALPPSGSTRLYPISATLSVEASSPHPLGPATLRQVD